MLPPEVAQDPERLGRFKREAQLLASLNHPNIAAIYGLEEADGKPFLALELVEGEDLKERLARGAIPVDEALEIAKQIAEALEEAHGKGIVHRDLKPANVKLTPDGKVKVLDFGLAKAWAGDASGIHSGTAQLSQSPTLAHTGTIAGVILGTAAYMSPEQARGKPVDKRADVWSFGVLVYEMLTGRSLFAGDTVTDVIAAVVTREPDLDALPKTTPRAVRRLLGRCLRKDPRTRLPDIGAARLELQEAQAGTAVEPEGDAGTVAHEAVRDESRRRRRERWAWVAIAIVLAGVSGFLLLRRLSEVAEPRPAAHFLLDTPEDVAFDDFDPVAFSPDGRHVVFAALTPNGTSQLFLRALDTPGARALPRTEGGHTPFWSPDGTAIAFQVESELRKVLLAGETVQRICTLPVPAIEGGAWSRSGTIVFAMGGATARLYSVPAAGGDAKALTTHDASRGETGHYWPQFLPDDVHLLAYIGSSRPENAGLHALSLQAPTERRRVLPDTLRMQYAAGYLLGVRDGSLTARPFDARRLVATGEAVPIAAPVAAWSNVRDWGWFSASSSGRLAWISGQASIESQLVWIDRTGRRLGALGKPGPYAQIGLSPDGRRVAVEIPDQQGRFDLWLLDTARGVASRLTTDPANDRDLVWSPDGQRVVFSSEAKGDQDLLVKGLQGSDAATAPPGIGQTKGERDIAKFWTAAGNTLLYKTIGVETTLWAASLDGQGGPEPLLKGFAVDNPQVSPDGRWLAYISTESGQFEVYVQPFRRRGARVRVSAEGGGQPRWRGDGRELFFLSPAGALLAVSVRESGSEVEVGMPTVLVAAKDLQAVIEGPDYSDYSVSPDGQKFLVKVPAGEVAPPKVHVLLDWPSLLR